MTYIPYLGTFFSHGTPVWPWPVINIANLEYRECRDFFCQATFRDFRDIDPYCGNRGQYIDHAESIFAARYWNTLTIY